jgi:hypothetical protein
MKEVFHIELAPIKADYNLIKWMIGVLIAMTIAHFFVTTQIKGKRI